MKKLLVIGTLFVALISVSVWEIVFSTRVFNDIHGILEVLEVSVFAQEDVDSEDNILLINKVNDKWQKNRNVLFCFGNHNVLRQVDEKLSGLKVMITINHVEDARVTVVVAKQLVKSILNDTHPHPTNLF